MKAVPIDAQNAVGRITRSWRTPCATQLDAIRLASTIVELTFRRPGRRHLVRRPAELAEYLRGLDADTQAHDRYLAWKATGPTPRFRAQVDGWRISPFCRLCTYLRGTRASREAGWTSR